jgi:hypothetical protein
MRLGRRAATTLVCPSLLQSRRWTREAMTGCRGQNGIVVDVARCPRLNGPHLVQMSSLILPASCWLKQAAKLLVRLMRQALPSARLQWFMTKRKLGLETPSGVECLLVLETKKVTWAGHSSSASKQVKETGNVSYGIPIRETRRLTPPRDNHPGSDRGPMWYAVGMGEEPQSTRLRPQSSGSCRPMKFAYTRGDCARLGTSRCGSQLARCPRSSG